MKIIIVSQQPINAICGMKPFQRKLAQESDMEVSCLQYVAEEQTDVIGEIMSRQPELLITVDLPGFEQSTLTDNIAYNLLNCKQLHLLLHDNLSNESYLGRPLNIAMFFYCVGDAYYDYLLRKYPDLPYLKKLPEWQTGAGRQAEEKNAEILYVAFQEMLRECLLRP